VIDQADQAHNGAPAQRSFALQHAARPLATGLAQVLCPFEPIVHLPFQRPVPAAQAQHLVELAGRQMRMQFDLVPAWVENPHLAAVPAHPYLLADVLGRDGIEGLVHLDVTVAMHGALAFLETGEQIGGQRQESFLFLGEQSPNLLARGAVKAYIGHGLFPVAQKLVFRAQALERAPAQGIALRYWIPRSVLPLCCGVLGKHGISAQP
jgi:hypothetical protein